MTEIHEAELSGFCSGVRRTIEKINQLLSANESDVFCVGYPVHNPQLTEKLKAKGLKIVKSVADVKRGATLIVRAHGFTTEMLEEAVRKGLKIVDTTCPTVRRAHEIVSKLNAEKYSIIISGVKKHPELESLVSRAGKNAVVIETSDEVRKLNLEGKIGFLSQTTQDPQVFKDSVSQLAARSWKEFRAFNTICPNMPARQKEAKELAAKVDCMLVLGGKMSSNTRRLYEVCKKINENTFHIESAEELDINEVKSCDRVGIAAGASTPDWIVKEVKAKLKSSQ